MRVRGERECQSCGTRWSYFETGKVTCPDCGSQVSVGLSERVEHTDDPVEFDLSSVRAAIGEAPREEVAEEAAAAARDYCRRSGFVHAGEIDPLSETYLAAAELREVGVTVARGFALAEEEELYYLSLLHGADRGGRPEPDAVPESIRDDRGRAVARGVGAYRSDLRRAVEDPEPAVSRTLSSLSAHRKRVDALDGDVPPREAEILVAVARDVGGYLRGEDETALARAGDRLDRL
ncbi:MAG: TFIIB-type zinc ribbon-containing protein [Haloarculaceae archaeon]